MLAFIHSKRLAHDLMVLAVAAMEVFFAWRASLMYAFILAGRVTAVELDIVRWLVFLAVGVFGFALATHRHAGVDAIRQKNDSWFSLAGVAGAVLVVVAHDLAATVYTVGAIDSFGAMVAVAGMCCLVLLPFLVGYMSHSIAEGIEQERKEGASRKIAQWKQEAELRYWQEFYSKYQPLADSNPALPAIGNKTHSAHLFLQSALASGSRPASEVQMEAAQAGIARSTLDLARQELGIKAQRVNNRWFWHRVS